MLPEKQAEFLEQLTFRMARDVHALHYLYSQDYGYHCLDLDLRDSSVIGLNGKVEQYFQAAEKNVVLPAAPERFWKLMSEKAGPSNSMVKKADHIFPLRLKNTAARRTAVLQLNLEREEARRVYA